MSHLSDIADILCTTVESFLPRFSPKDLVLVLCVDLRASHYDEQTDEDCTESRDILLAFHRPSNYTKVFAHVSDKAGGAPRPERMFHDEWTCVSDHDSGWRQDGVHRTLALACGDLQKRFSHLPAKQRREVRLSACLSSFQPPQFYRARIERIDTPEGPRCRENTLQVTKPVLLRAEPVPPSDASSQASHGAALYFLPTP